MKLVSESVKKVIVKEIKAQEGLIKLLELREKEYGVNYVAEKQEIQNSINYYNNFLKEE
jgi:hypothetical protein